MQMANTTTITGNLTREPEIRYTREGQATAQLGVAVNRRWQDRTTQEWQEPTADFHVICWGDPAEKVAVSLPKGMGVVVTGRLEHRTWETEEGEHRSKVEITADEVGASLRFATAEVHKVERRGGGGGGAGGGRPRGGGGADGGGGLSGALADHHVRVARADGAFRRGDGTPRGGSGHGGGCGSRRSRLG